MTRFLTVCSIGVAALASSATAQIYDNGAVNMANGNEMTCWLQAEDFVLNSNELLGGAACGVLDLSIDGQINNWDGTGDWAIYKDAGNSPGGAIASGAMNNLVTTPIGNNGSWEFYDFTFDFGGQCVPVDAGTKYWIEFHLNQGFPCTFQQYLATTNGNGTSTGHEDFNGQGVWNDNGQEHSFRLYGCVPTPGTAALLGLGGLAGLRRRR